MASPSLSLHRSLKGLQKAATVLLSLGPAASAKILKQLPEEEVDAVLTEFQYWHPQRTGGYPESRETR